MGGRYLGRGGGHSTRPGNGAAGAGGCARTGGGATTEQDRGGEKAQDAWAPTRFRGAGPCQGVRVGARKTGGRRVRAVPRAQRPGFGAESLFPSGGAAGCRVCAFSGAPGVAWSQLSSPQGRPWSNRKRGDPESAGMWTRRDSSGHLLGCINFLPPSLPPTRGIVVSITSQRGLPGLTH